MRLLRPRRLPAESRSCEVTRLRRQRPGNQFRAGMHPARNEDKAARPVEEFLAEDPERLARILEKLKTPLKDAAAVNSARSRAVPGDKGHGASSRVRLRRTREVQPAPAGHSKVPCAGCGVRLAGGRHGALAGADIGHQGDSRAAPTAGRV
ncbi:MAG: hypothetical protein J2P21_18010 [Chloracidobacterium sp.]|nr:hypothetical protein [Chloracidobacterium sp.]